MKSITRVVACCFSYSVYRHSCWPPTRQRSAAPLRTRSAQSFKTPRSNWLPLTAAKLCRAQPPDAGGRYSFSVTSEGRFRIRAEAASFQPALSEQKFAGGNHPAEIDLTLSPSVVAQQIVVTATGVPTPEVQTGASISVLSEESLATRRAVEEELRIRAWS